MRYNEEEEELPELGKYDMSMTKAEIIEAYGVKDGNDEHRYLSAIDCSGLTDLPVSVAFRSLVNLEKAKLISLDFPKIAEHEIFKVVCDETNNTLEDQENNVLNVDVWVKK
jgi:hypothetical protein